MYNLAKCNNLSYVLHFYYQWDAVTNNRIQQVMLLYRKYKASRKLVHPKRHTGCAIFQGLCIFLYNNTKGLYAVYYLAIILYYIILGFEPHRCGEKSMMLTTTLLL